MNSREFKRQLNTMPAGAKVVYFTGSLMFTRMLSKELDELANTVWRLAGMRWVPNARPSAPEDHTGQWLPKGEQRIVLIQRKLSEPLGWEYIAVKL